MAEQPKEDHASPDDIEARIAAVEQYLANAEAPSNGDTSTGGVALHIPGGHAIVFSNETLRAGTYALAAVLLVTLLLICLRRRGLGSRGAQQD